MNTDMAAVLRRIAKRLKAVKLTANAASKKAGKPDAIRNLQRAVESGGRQGITVATLTALAPVLATTMAWLLEGKGVEDTAAAEATIPVWGKAGAGGAIHSFHDNGEIGRIAAPPDANDTTAAVEIAGESLGKLFDGWYAVYDEVRAPATADMLGTLCVVGLVDGSVYIKQLKKGRGKRFTLESNYEPPVYDVEVRWAARVKEIIPP